MLVPIALLIIELPIELEVTEVDGTVTVLGATPLGPTTVFTLASTDTK